MEVHLGVITVGDGGSQGGVLSVDEQVEALVRGLIALVRSRTSPDSGGGSTLLDVDVDDVRCRLEVTNPVEAVAAQGRLSPREAEVVRMVAQGYPNKTIAAVLEISAFTVSSYLRRIFAKLDVNSRAAMVALVIENRLLPAPSERLGLVKSNSRNGEQSADVILADA